MLGGNLILDARKQFPALLTSILLKSYSQQNLFPARLYRSINGRIKCGLFMVLATGFVTYAISRTLVQRSYASRVEKIRIGSVDDRLTSAYSKSFTLIHHSTKLRCNKKNYRPLKLAFNFLKYALISM